MTGDLSNTERLKALYDPHHVRHVDVANGGAPVRVGIDDRMLRSEEGTGVAVYARTLSRCLAEVGAEPLILGEGDGRNTRPRAMRWLAAARTDPRIATVPVETPGTSAIPDLFREAQVFFNLHGRTLPIAFDDPPIVMHWTYPIPMHVIGARNIYTVHDLIPLTHPDLTPIPTARHRRMLQAIAARADLLVTVSETMRGEIADRLGHDPDRVVNTWQAVEAPLQVDPPLPEGLQAGHFFLFCGRVERRKNLAALAEAHAASGVRFPLVIAGPRLPDEEPLEALLAAHPGVKRLGFMPRDALLGLMRRARALLFPTLAEGFGLPIVEAMTLGCPVVTSNRGATAEIAGDAAILVDPDRTEALVAAIVRLAADDGLCADLRARGFARAHSFTPQRYARRLRALYARALAMPIAEGAVR